MKILLTGGAGFIGSHLIEGYLAKGYQVIVVDDLSHPIEDYKKTVEKTKLYKVDINNFHLLEKIFKKEKPFIVNHHAAQSSISSKGEDLFKTNVLGTLNLLKLSRENKVRKFIFASSAAVYGEVDKLPIKETAVIKPFSEYGISKAIAEYYIGLFNKDFQTIVFRYSNVYGLRQNSSAEGGVVSIFKNNIKNKKDSIIFGDGRQTRDFINVEDIVLANLRAIRIKKSEIYNISAMKETTINELFRLVNLRKKGKFMFKKGRKGDIRKSWLNNNKAKRELLWRPSVGLEKGLK